MLERVLVPEPVKTLPKPESSVTEPTEISVKLKDLEDAFFGSFEDLAVSDASFKKNVTDDSSTSSETKSPPPEPSSSFYSQFSRSQSEPPIGTSVVTEEFPRKSARQLIMELERKAKGNPEPVPVTRVSSSNPKPQRIGLLEQFAQMAVEVPAFKVVNDPEFSKLKRDIVRGARLRKGSTNKIGSSDETTDDETGED